MTSHTVTRSLPALLLLMAVAVLLILSGASTAGLVFGLVVAGITAILLGSMFVYEAGHDDAHRRMPNEHLYRRPHTG